MGGIASLKDLEDGYFDDVPIEGLLYDVGTGFATLDMSLENPARAMSITFEDVVLTRVYSESDFTAAESLLKGVDELDDIPLAVVSELTSTQADRWSFRHLADENLLPVELTIRKADQPLRTVLIDAAGLHMLIVCHSYRITESPR